MVTSRVKVLTQLKLRQLCTNSKTGWHKLLATATILLASFTFLFLQVSPYHDETDPILTAVRMILSILVEQIKKSKNVILPGGFEDEESVH